MSTIQSAVTAIVQGIADILPSGIDCRQISIPIDADELARSIYRVPSVHLCLLGASLSGTVGGSPVASLSLCAYVLCESIRPDKRTVAMLSLIDLLLRRIDGARWSCDGFQRPSNVAARLAHSAELDRRAVTIWEVSWSQALTLDNDISLDDLIDFTGVDTVVLPRCADA